MLNEEQLQEATVKCAADILAGQWVNIKLGANEYEVALGFLGGSPRYIWSVQFANGVIMETNIKTLANTQRERTWQVEEFVRPLLKWCVEFESHDDPLKD